MITTDDLIHCAQQYGRDTKQDYDAIETMDVEELRHLARCYVVHTKVLTEGILEVLSTEPRPDYRQPRVVEVENAYAKNPMWRVIYDETSHTHEDARWLGVALLRCADRVASLSARDD